MNDTVKRNSQPHLIAPNAGTPLTGSLEKPGLPAPENTPSNNFTRSSIEHLMGLAKEVTGKRKNAKTINAACNCYSQVYKFLRLNVDMQKMQQAQNRPRKEPQARFENGVPGAISHDEIEKLDNSRINQVKQALEHFGGNKTRAAAALGCSIRSLRNWVAERDELAEYRLDPPERQAPPARIYGTE